jgi:arsenite methyltransferase
LDHWAQWVLQRAYGDSAVQQEAARDRLEEIRDRVLDHAALDTDATVLDIGAGDGLVGFGAAQRLGARSHIAFSDVSADLLAHCQDRATQLGVLDKCSFVQAAAEDLSPFADESFDVVTLRSVLIYVADKAAAFREIWRVLRVGGRLSLFEPINRFGKPEPGDRFWGYEVAPDVRDLAARLKAKYASLQPRTDPMFDFDERDLVRLAEGAGFSEIHATLEIAIGPRDRTEALEWPVFTKMAPNPTVPSFEEAVAEVLDDAEAKRLEARLRPLVECGAGTKRIAFSYLWAVKNERATEVVKSAAR